MAHNTPASCRRWNQEKKMGLDWTHASQTDFQHQQTNFDMEPQESKRGWLKNTWCRDMEAEMNKIVYSCKRLKTKAQDRGLWQIVVCSLSKYEACKHCLAMFKMSVFSFTANILPSSLHQFLYLLDAFKLLLKMFFPPGSSKLLIHCHMTGKPLQTVGVMQFDNVCSLLTSAWRCTTGTMIFPTSMFVFLFWQKYFWLLFL